MSTPQAIYPVDLHTHTNRSDGCDTPAESIRHAAEAGLRIYAMTDHDIVPPSEIDVDGQMLSPSDYASALGVTLIPGTEISCDTELEDVHLVCLGCDWSDPFFAEMSAAVVQSKIDGYEKLLEALTAADMPVTMDEVLNSGASPIPKEKVQKKMIFELLAKKGFAENWQSAKLLIKNTPAFQIRRVKPDPVDVIHHVHKAGGIVILAHPYLISLPDSECVSYIENLITAGLDGIEAAYPYNKTSYGGTLSPVEIEREVRERYAGRLPIISGGSDYHNDGRKGVQNPRNLGEKGLTLEEFFGCEPLASLVRRK